jgi:hypothetical protein
MHKLIMQSVLSAHQQKNKRKMGDIGFDLFNTWGRSALGSDE